MLSESEVYQIKLRSTNASSGHDSKYIVSDTDVPDSRRGAFSTHNTSPSCLVSTRIKFPSSEEPPPLLVKVYVTVAGSPGIGVDGDTESIETVS